MAESDDDDRTIGGGASFRVDPSREISSVLDELEDLLKNGDVIAELSAEDFAMVAEEIRGRLELTRSADGPPKNGHGG